VWPWYLQWSWPLLLDCDVTSVSIQKYPRLAEALMKYSSALTNSAAVKRSVVEEGFYCRVWCKVGDDILEACFCGTSWRGTSNSLAVRENIRHLFLVLSVLLSNCISIISFIFLFVCVYYYYYLLQFCLHCVLLPMFMSCIGYDHKTE